MRLIHFEMKKRNTYYGFLILLFAMGSTNAQNTNSELHNAVDSINAILKANPLAYYTDNNKISAFVKKISANNKALLPSLTAFPNPKARQKKANKGNSYQIVVHQKEYEHWICLP